MVRVTLTWYEIEHAAWVGVRRQLEGLKAGLKDAHGYDGSAGWQQHILGALGECAFAKYQGWYWDGSVNTFKRRPDVGAVEVRTRSRHAYDLLVREDDADDARFVLVTGTGPEFHVHGWLLGTDAKRPQYLHTYGDRPPAYFVPAADLHPFSE